MQVLALWQKSEANGLFSFLEEYARRGVVAVQSVDYEI